MLRGMSGGVREEDREDVTALHPPDLRPTVPNYPHLYQKIRPTVTTPTGGKFEAVVMVFDPATRAFSDGEDCYAVEQNGLTDLDTTKHYDGRLSGFDTDRQVYTISKLTGTVDGYQTIQEEGVDLPQRSKLNLTGFGVQGEDEEAEDRTNAVINPQVCIIKTVAIAARSGTTVTSESCEQFENDGGTLTTLGTSIDVTNLSELDVIADQYAVAVMDERGVWVITNYWSLELTTCEELDSYTDEMAQDAVGGILSDSSTIDLAYDDAGNTISASTIGFTGSL